MSGKGVSGFSIIISSIIIGASIIGGFIIMNGGEVIKNEHVIATTQGEVKLGDIYAEKRLLTINLSDVKGNQIISIKNINPDDYIKSIDDEMQRQINDYSNQISQEGITPDTLTINVAGQLTVTSEMEYKAKNIPTFTLTLDEINVPIQKGSVIKNAIVATTSSFVESSHKKYIENTFIK